MEEASENGKESPHSPHANWLIDWLIKEDYGLLGSLLGLHDPCEWKQYIPYNIRNPPQQCSVASHNTGTHKYNTAVTSRLSHASTHVTSRINIQQHFSPSWHHGPTTVYRQICGPFTTYCQSCGLLLKIISTQLLGHNSRWYLKSE
jgi:hypothetical protein